VEPTSAKTALDSLHLLIGLCGFFILGIGGFVLKLQAMRRQDLKEIWDKINAQHNSSQAQELSVLNAINNAKTENAAQVSGVRAEAKADLAEAANKLEESIRRVDARMMTQEDGRHHFQTIENSMGNLTESLSALTTKVDGLLSNYTRLDERLKSSTDKAA
jgi:restriction endonuclease